MFTTFLMLNDVDKETRRGNHDIEPGGRGINGILELLRSPEAMRRQHLDSFLYVVHIHTDKHPVLREIARCNVQIKTIRILHANTGDILIRHPLFLMPSSKTDRLKKLNDGLRYVQKGVVW